MPAQKRGKIGHESIIDLKQTRVSASDLHGLDYACLVLSATEFDPAGAVWEAAPSVS